MASYDHETIELDRDCEVTVIPSGEKMLLTRGMKILVTQTLGDSVTAQTSWGHLVRINAQDSAALGLTEPLQDVPALDARPFHLDQVIAELKNVFDPEIPINVVDLGLIYLCEAEPLPDGTHRVVIEMSMTAPGCGMGDVLKEDARAAAQSVPGVSEVSVELVWDPVWGRDRMSEAALMQLGMY